MRITLIRLVLTLVEPGGVTAPEHGTDDLDLPLARDPEGAPWVPPTSVAGIMRRIPGIDADTLFGYETDTSGQSSTIHVLGTSVRLPDGLQPHRRGRNAMDRRRGAPRATHLFTSEVLPRGSLVEVYLRWNNAPKDNLAAFMKAVATWRPLIGRGASTGLGRCRSSALGERTLNLGRTSELVEWLTHTGPDLFAGIPVAALDQDANEELLLDIRWRIADALHIGSGKGSGKSVRDPGSGPEIATVVGGKDAPEAPGSSWKGLLRARCEYILRSIGITACDTATCGVCPTCALFGHGTPARETHAPASAGRGARLRCHQSLLESDPHHGGSTVVVDQRTHVAIDRFSGGAHQGLLYTDEVVLSGTLRLQVESIPHRPPPPWAHGLLLAAVRDIADGLIGLGGRTTRGYGTLQRIDDTGHAMPALTAEETSHVRHALHLLAQETNHAR